MSINFPFNPHNTKENGLYCCPHFTDGDTEAQRGEATCPRSHSLQKPGLKPGDNQTHVLKFEVYFGEGKREGRKEGKRGREEGRKGGRKEGREGGRGEGREGREKEGMNIYR